MLQNIISFSLRNKLIVLLMTAGLIIWGAYSFKQLPIDAVPDITNNQVQVISAAPDLAAPEVERLITFPIEQALASIPGKIELRSFSRFGLSLVTIVFDDETDIYLARQQVSEKLGQAAAQIPSGLTQPELAPVTTGLGEIYQYTLDVDPSFRETYSLSDLRTIQDWIVRRQLLGAQGVADISSFGGYLKQYEVSIDPAQLRAMHISVSDVFDALETNNQNTGGSYIEKGEEALLIRTEGLLNTADDVAKVVVKTTHGNVPVLIKDVAQVNEGHAVRYGAMTRDTAGEAVGGVVLMLKGENSSAVIESVKSRMELISKTLPAGIRIKPYLDRTKLVNKSIRTVRNNLAEGALIVIFVLVLLLGNFRAGLVVASVIPLAMLFALGLMNVFGVSGNLMSLGAIDFGLIVDGAVIIVEAVIHALFIGRQPNESFTISRHQLDNLVGNSAGKMMRFAAFGQLIILIVYIPILSLTGIEGKMFKPMAETVSFAILGALILSLTWVPVATSLFLGKRHRYRSGLSDRIMQFLAKAYRPMLNRVLEAPRIAVLVAISALAGTFFLFSNLGGEFIPSLDEGDFSIETRLPTGSSLKESVRVSNEAGRILMNQFPEVLAVTGKIGTSEIPTDPMPIEATDLIVTLKDKNEWVSAKNKDELANKMALALEAIPGASFGFQQPIQMRFNELMTGARQDVVVKIFGEDLQELSKLAAGVAEISRQIEGAEDVYLEQITGLPQLVIQIRRDALARFGVSVEEVNQLVNTAFAGREAGLIYEGEKRFSLVVRLEQSLRENPKSANSLFIQTISGDMIPLSELADIQILEGPVQIQREDARRRIIVGFNVRNRDVESVVEDLSSLIEEKIALPAGYSIHYGGQFENLIEARQRLSIAVPLALLLIFVLLFFAFSSVKYALLIFSAVPFSAIGGVLALYFRGLPFSISAGVGFIALFGVAVLNGIVLVGAINQYKSEMTDLKEAIKKGAMERLRPIMMTALVASLGFLPMAISQSSGAEVQRPLATVVIGGLVTATLLTLLLLPVIYLITERKKLSKAAAGLLLLAFLPVTGLKAQQELPLDSCIKMAIRTHPSIRSMEVQQKAAEKNIQSAWDIGGTDISFMGGQYNSAYKDFQFGLDQGIPFPGKKMAEFKLLKTEVEILGSSELIARKQLTMLVEELWLKTAIAKRRLVLLDSLTALTSQLRNMALLRYNTGESTLLEKLIIEQKAEMAESELLQAKESMQSLQRQLTLLCGAQLPVTAPAIQSSKAIYSDLLLNEPQWLNHPAIQYQLSVIRKADQQLGLEKMKLFPDLRIGFFNQSLTGIQEINGEQINFTRADRFTGYTAGLSIPIWFVPQKARISAKKLDADAARLNHEDALLSLQLRYERLSSELRNSLVGLQLLEQTQLKVSEKALAAASLAWKQGQLSYLELIYVVDQHVQIQKNWLSKLESITETTVQLHFLQN